MQSAVHSAGYRINRWAAARAVLGRRLAKNRLDSRLTETLEKWETPLSAGRPLEELQLSFGLAGNRLWLSGGGVDHALERALLHLPALRGFWRQELRESHFAALKAIVPQAWVREGDDAVPPGAVIHGLGIASWQQMERLGERVPAVVAEGHFLTEQNLPETRLNAFYGRDDKTRVVLRSVEALP